MPSMIAVRLVRGSKRTCMRLVRSKAVLALPLQARADSGCLSVRGQVVHMDIKPANILLHSSRVAKIGDLGISRYLVDGCLSTITSRGAKYFISSSYSHPMFVA